LAGLIHALCDGHGRRHATQVTRGNVADITAAATLVSAVAQPGDLLGDKGYDANHLRRFVAEHGPAAVIPSIISRKVAIPHDAERYRRRNVIERPFCRTRDIPRHRQGGESRSVIVSSLLSRSLVRRAMPRRWSPAPAA
jgi:transposase